MIEKNETYSATENDESFIIEGQNGARTLEGTVPIYGAKNDALKIMAATLLFEDSVAIKNIPDVLDVIALSALLETVGVEVDKTEERLTLHAPKQAHTALQEDEAKKLRASVVLTGPLLARYGSVSFPHPGGCVIGTRPIDLFIRSFELMGATHTKDDEYHHITAPNGLHGADIFFRLASVGATETMLMAAILAHGTTVLRNAAMEPEIQHLSHYLIECGADIKGVGTPTITIEGRDGETLHTHGVSYTVMPDRIETGSFAILAALAGNHIQITNCNPDHIRALLALFDESGVTYKRDSSSLIIQKSLAPYKAVSVRTHEYPGFSTDLQAPMTVFLTQTVGESMVFETLFEGRLRYSDDIVRMGADITMFDPHRILIRGPKALTGRKLEAPDLRAGLAYIIAGTIAQGTTIIRAARHIDRGYGHIEKRLNAIGVRIKRI